MKNILKNKAGFSNIFFVAGLLLASNLYADDLCYEIHPDSVVFNKESINNVNVERHITIKSLSKERNVTISYVVKGHSLFGYFNNIGIDEKSKSDKADNPDVYEYACTKYKLNKFGKYVSYSATCKDSDPIFRADTESYIEPLGFFPATLLPIWTNGINYNLSDMDVNDDTTKQHDIWIKKIGTTGIEDEIANMLKSSNTRLYAKYWKNGKKYYVDINPCAGSVPDISVSDAFLPSPEKMTPMTFHVKIKGDLEKGITIGDKIYIHYHTEDGSVKAGIDYKPVLDGILVIDKGTKSLDIDVQIMPHAHIGKFYLVFDDIYGARIDNIKAIGSILYVSSINKHSSKGWSGVGIDNSYNDVNKNTVGLSMSSDENLNKQFYHKLNW